MKMGKVTSCFLLICLVLTGFSFLAGCAQMKPDTGMVKTDAGSVSGIIENGLRMYRGIPYAAPPTGDLRWRPPAQVKPWDGTRNATGFSAMCPQPSTSNPTPGEMSEDCLYLNVWTPAKSADEKLPVMVFIHGGAFAEGTGSDPLYNGSALAGKGVVVVTLNYRMGALGFLAHPQLDNESANNTSGNYGLLDQQAALRWVQRNIGAFGGDPSRVTIFGQSAGGSSVLVHLVSPQSKGLYRQAIVESGPLWTNGTILDIFGSKADGERYGEEYAKSLGYEGPEAIAQMRTLSAEELVNATPWPASTFWRIHTLGFKPVADGWIIPDAPDTMFLSHRENPVPLIIGNNANDGITLTANANMTVADYKQFLQDNFGKDAGAVFAKYPANSTPDVQHQLSRMMTAYDFTDAAKFAAGSMADLNQSTYLYRFSYDLPGQPLGAFHSSELLMVFRPPGTFPDPTSTRVSENMMDLWTRFAKTGDPNGGMNVTWPKYTREQGQYLDINDTLTVKNFAGSPASPAPGSWKFVVFGDSPDPAKNTTTGVSPALSIIAPAVAAEKPDLVIYTGDLVNGWILTNASPVEGNYPVQFKNWEEAVSPIHNYETGTGVPLYVLRGNHEDGPDKTITPLLDAYLATVASGMPVNGPPGEEKLTYSFTHHDAKIIAIDDYSLHDGLKETANQTWLDEQLTQDRKPFLFVFGHSPAYLADNDKEDMLWGIAIHPAERDQFWTSLVNNHVPAYFCGHTHLYVRGESQGIQQIITGNGGAAMSAFNPVLADPNLTIEYPVGNVSVSDQKVGYLVITVHEDSGTFDGIQKVYNPAARSWETGDTFTINSR